MLTEVKWGFIGCGEVTEKKSGPAFSLIPGSSVVAVMSRNPERARSYAQRHHIPRWYTDPLQLIQDPEVNAVYIATPPSSHVTFAIMAMKNGKPVYVEKPLAATYEECLRVNRVAQQTKQPCFVAYYRRYLPYFIKVKEIIQDNIIGTVQAVQIRFAVPPRDLDYNRHQLPWRLQPDIAGGGYFYDLAPHQLDLLQQLFGPITHATGYATNRANLYPTEDTVSAAFQFANNIPGSGTWSFCAHQSARTDRIQIIGDQGQLHFSVFTYEPITLQTKEGSEELQIPNPPHVQLPLIEQVVKHLQGTATCTLDSVSATSVNWVMDKILRKL